jgi:aldose 1-epimerase
MRAALLAAVLPLTLPFMTQAANYGVQQVKVDGVEVIRLTDENHKIQLSIAPSLGNNLYEFLVNGKNIMWFPQKSLADYKAKPTFSGNPFLAPWANRLDHDGFYANGKHYALNSALNNYRRDGAKQPIHGMVTNAQWKVIDQNADGEKAQVTSRLEFWRSPDWMAQFPFAHTIDMTYRLRDGILEVETAIENLSTDPMPVSIGYHPYFRLHDSPRNSWKVTLPAKESYVLSSSLVATGEKKPMPYSTSKQALQGISLDDVLGSLVPGESGRTEFAVEGAKERIAVLYGPKYPVAVVYSPADRDFICFEPMTGPTNAFNLKQAGKYEALQSIPAGGKWRESFWIHPSGF